MLQALGNKAVALLPAALQQKIEPIIARFLKGAQSGQREKETSTAALIVFASRVAGAGLAYLLQVFLARIIGPTDYGIFVTVWTIVLVLSLLACFGFGVSVLRFIPEYLAKKEYGLLNGLLISSRISPLITSSAVAAVGMAIAWFFSDFIAQPYILTLFLMAICLPLQTMSEVQSGVAQAFNLQLISAFPGYIARPLLIIASMTTALVLGFPVTAATACICAIFAVWLSFMGQFFVLRKRLKTTVPVAPKAYNYGYWLKISAPMALIEAFFQLITSADVVMVSFWETPDQVGIYFAAARTLALTHFVYFAIKAAVTAPLSHLYHSDDLDEMRRFMVKASKMTFWPTLVLSILILPVAPLLLRLFGAQYVEATPVLYILVFGVLARASIGPVDALLMISGRETLCAKIYGGVFALNVVFNFLLIPRFGILGAAMATTLAIMIEAVIVAYFARAQLQVFSFVFTRTKSC